MDPKFNCKKKKNQIPQTTYDGMRGGGRPPCPPPCRPGGAGVGLEGTAGAGLPPEGTGGGALEDADGGGPPRPLWTPGEGGPRPPMLEGGKWLAYQKGTGVY